MAGKLLPDIVAASLGGVIAGGMLEPSASGTAAFDAAAGFASNGYGEHSPAKYSMFAAPRIEVVMTMMFLIIIMGSTDQRAGQPRGAVLRLRPAARRVEPPSG